MALFLALFALIGQPATPDAVTRLAFLDVHDDTLAEDRRYTRYLSMHAVPAGDRPALRKVVDYATNATSFRSEFGHPEPVGDLLLKVDLRKSGWDYPARRKRLAELERRGVRFDFADAEARRIFLDPWEALGRLDPYFEANHHDASGHLVIGWVDTAVTNAIRRETYSNKPVLRADWAIGAILHEKSFGGIYGDLLMHPPKEADGYKALLIDIEAANRDNQLRQGGAVLASTVALNNRELRLTYNPYPLGGGYYWETDDFNVDARGDKSILERFAGATKHDGRETIYSLPNRLQAYRLFDGSGNSVDVVPESIAQVKEPLLPPRETRVVNSYKCIECHLSGIRDFSDVVRKTFLKREFKLKVRSYDPHVVDDQIEALEDYYSSTLGTTIRAQQESYVKALKEACGMDGNATATNVVSAVEVYRHDLVTPEMAAREMGYDPDWSRLAWMGASFPYTTYGVRYEGNPQLAVLASGQGIKRAAWEQSVADAMRMVRELAKRVK